ncbi:MAG: hypothetical protein Q4F67_15730, partial [Propionibacteriaceae bacterium]|nr:hypothetical protein [Propionibacteriaceae bacterium]
EPADPPLSRTEAEARSLEQGKELWAAVDTDETIAALVTGADAIAAADLGGVRTAHHLARRHEIAIATQGIVPALVELAARAE